MGVFEFDKFAKGTMVSLLPHWPWVDSMFCVSGLHLKDSL
jgi:hypothetical protein